MNGADIGGYNGADAQIINPPQGRAAGTSVSSDKPINSLKVKVTDSNGKVYDYTYGN